MAPRPLSPLVLALGGAAAVLGSVLFILWKTYFGRGRERRWDQSEAWWGAEPAHLPEWDEWDVSAGPGSAPPRVRPRGVSATLSARSTRVGTWRRGPGAGERVAGSRESRNQGVGGRLWGVGGAASELASSRVLELRGRGPRPTSGPHRFQPALSRRLRYARGPGVPGEVLRPLR